MAEGLMWGVGYEVRAHGHQQEQKGKAGGDGEAGFEAANFPLPGFHLHIRTDDLFLYGRVPCWRMVSLIRSGDRICGSKAMMARSLRKSS